ncbi:MAG TPA: caspase family protein [Spirochaetia bacterium]|nr:caspase family protein [Spirochaetia bacterium]
MRRVILGAVAALVLSAGLPAAAHAEPGAPLRRIAFVTGSNDGGPALQKLRYAESDARSFADVLEDIGGVRAKDLVLVSGSSLQRFQDGLQRVHQMVGSPREMDERRELIFYYSGHSDDDGLILGPDRVRWDDLRRELSDMPADVKVAIVDSCSSGSLTRAKGGQPRPAFLYDASSDMSGHAYLTSASAEEAAQESDRIGSSFFTHYLISGLRGAADTVGDGRVTLNEAYTYAFQETLASTERTQYGPQHPAYDINLSGSGDLVLTDLRSSSGILKISEDVAGRLYFRDSDGDLAVELNKSAGQSTELGLEPGVYSVVLDGKASRREGTVRVTGREPAVLTTASLHDAPLDKSTARGPEEQAAAPNKEPPRKEGGAALGAAVGEIVGTTIGNAVDAAVSAAMAAAGVAGAHVPADRGAPSGGTGAEAGGDSGDTGPGPDGSSSSGLERRPTPQVFELGIVPDFGNGVFSSHVDHVVGLNLLAGSSGSSYGFEVGGLANFESGEVIGFQAAGLVNASLGPVTAYQTAGLVNYTRGSVVFFQSAGLVNVGASLVGAQSAGLVNVVQGSTIGGQVAGLVNWSGLDVIGAQVAGVGNWAGADVSGAQIAGVANWGRSVRGPQISVINVADSVTGVQVGVINIAGHVTGAQVGVLNISREIDGVPLGLLSIEERGRHALDLWVDADGVPYVALSLGTRYLYTVLSAGWRSGSSPATWSFGAGVGGRASFQRTFVDADISMVAEQSGASSWDGSPEGFLYPRFKAVLGYQVSSWLALDAGVSVRILVPSLSSSLDGYNPRRAVLQPSLVAGVHLG